MSLIEKATRSLVTAPSHLNCLYRTIMAASSTNDNYTKCNSIYSLPFSGNVYVGPVRIFCGERFLGQASVKNRSIVIEVWIQDIAATINNFAFAFSEGTIQDSNTHKPTHRLARIKEKQIQRDQ